MLPPAFLDELRSRTPMQPLVSRTVRLARSGRQWKGCCPFHGERTPSFYVYDDHFHCFGCGAHGDAIAFVMQSAGSSFLEAVEHLAGEAGLQVPKASPEAAAAERRRADLTTVVECVAAAYERRLHLPEGRAALAYLRDRGLSDDTIRQFGLGWSGEGRGAIAADLARDGIARDQLVEAGVMRRDEESGRITDLFFNRVMFPIRDRRGRIISFGGRVTGDGQPKYVNGPETALFSKRRTLYGLHLARAGVQAGHALLVVEGYMDVIALHQAGFAGAVAPLGTALTEEHLTELWRLSSAPVLCFDGDAAGRRAAARTAELALPAIGIDRGLSFVTLPPGEDPDSLIRHGGPNAMWALSAESFSVAVFNLLRQPGGEPTAELRAAFQARLAAAAGRIQDKVLASEVRRTWFARARREAGPVVADDEAGDGTAAQACFEACATRFADATARAHARFAHLAAGLGETGLAGLIVAAPVLEAEGRFEVLSEGRPRKSQWRILLAVRDGAPNPDYSDGGLDDTARQSVLAGAIVDLVACDPELMRVTSRLTGAAPVLGWPMQPELLSGPARIHETPYAWLRDGCRGAVLIGDELQVQDWLLRCERGVTAARLPMAEALHKKLSRAGVVRPSVWVREAA